MLTSRLLACSLLLMPRTILSPHFFSVEVSGHWFEFQLTKLGHLRLVSCDGRWNNRANRCEDQVSPYAWTAAWDAARIEVARRFPVSRVAA